MTKNRRGVNRITPELYAEIKAKLHNPADDLKVMKEYGIGKTSAQSIRNTKNYEEYHSKASRQKAERDLCKVCENAKYDREDSAEDEAIDPKLGVVITTHHEDEPTVLAQIVGGFLVVCLMLIAVGVTLGILRWALGF